jgi:PEP-CTERM motif-containing protein
MKTKFALGLLLVGITAGTLWAGGLQPISPDGGGDDVQPIGPASDQDSGNLQPGPGVVAVPEPSSISLIAGSAIVGSWFCLRRRRSRS